MKSHSLNVLMLLSLVCLTACSQQVIKTETQSTTKTYYVESEKTQEQLQQIAFQRQAEQQRQLALQQQQKQQQAAKVRAAQQAASQRQVNNSSVLAGDVYELYGIGDQIFKNETGGRIDQLTHWNLREDFASMGIGHFTWYPAGRAQRFGNTFPGLLDYLQQNGVQLPAWVQRARFEGAPWRTREELMRAKSTPEVRIVRCVRCLS